MGNNMEQQELSDIVGRSIKWSNHLKNCLAVSNKSKHRLPYDLAIPHQDIYPKEMSAHVHQKTYTRGAPG